MHTASCKFLPWLTLLLVSTSYAALPGAFTVGIDLGQGQDFVSDSNWASEASLATAHGAGTNPVTSNSQHNLAVGASLGYVLNQLETPLGPVNYGLETGFRVLGGGQRTTTWSNGNQENLKNSVNFARLNLSAEMPLAQSGISLLGRAGVALVSDKTQYLTNITGIPGVSNFNQTQDAAAPYWALGIGLGGSFAQFDVMYEYVGMPTASSHPLAGGTVSGVNNIGSITVGASLAF